MSPYWQRYSLDGWPVDKRAHDVMRHENSFGGEAGGVVGDESDGTRWTNGLTGAYWTGNRQSPPQELQQRRREADLSILLRNSIEDGSIGAIGITALCPRLGIIFITLSEPLWAEVVGIAEGFVDALHRFSACHEHLRLFSIESSRKSAAGTYPLKGRGAGPWVGSHEDGLVRHGWLSSSDSRNGTRYESVFQES
jgi:hypothetical protein